MSANIQTNTIDPLIEKAIHRLPQATWYEGEIPEDAMVVLDAFVLQQKDLPGSMADTHLRIALIEGETSKTWDSLKTHHEKVYSKTQSSVPPLPRNAVLIGHVACHEEQQVEYSYGVFRELAEKIARQKGWVTADISTRKPTIRMSDKLDIPLYKVLSEEKQLAPKLAKKPWRVFQRESGNQLKIKTWTLSHYFFIMLIVGLLSAMAFTVIFANSLPIWLILIIDLCLLGMISLSFITENKILLDKENIYLTVDNVILGVFYQSKERHQLHWKEVEDLQTINTNNDASNLEQLTIISDRKIICLPMSDPQWVLQRITKWLQEHQKEIKD